ncbi:hypothetical protein SARC_09435 [Sphaeroforma arctica JP610]|uniref:Uncharacterized protein n=1 Tax=Sphaeroforma arctica JP610 TaxID=667725 RepID=A0A0L0FMY7_9EUKA|nr:hypothetical protein SARC_09435 [Sphaeroforma arctica JP610]KNC78117.1 hypothetical protein SARC_09435 [Sphaeroforma arctica JP610]|eukprot:XP_014152019.1 hypothetical protein SARC_09435 [Sphaeroforma arctica JP610]
MKFFATTFVLASASAVTMASSSGTSSFELCKKWIKDNECPAGFKYNELAKDVRIKPHGVSWSTFDPMVLCCTPDQCHDMIPSKSPCDNGYKTGHDGCKLPECRPKSCPAAKPQMEFEMYCQWGFKLGEDGCEIAECREEPNSEWLTCKNNNQDVCKDKYNKKVKNNRKCQRWFNNSHRNMKCASHFCCKD